MLILQKSKYFPSNISDKVVLNETIMAASQSTDVKVTMC